MKIAVLADTHVGVRGDHPAFLDNFRDFIEKVFWPRVDAEDIRTVIHAGDLVDRRKYINFSTAQLMRSVLITPMITRGIEFHHVLGNHDVYYKNRVSTNVMGELYHSVDTAKFKWYKEAATVPFGGALILFIPWICEENKAQVLREIEATHAQICVGHCAIEGFEFYKGHLATGGDMLSKKLFRKFDVAAFGHFHTQGRDGGIRYLGATGEYVWSDADDPRGFHIFDTETREFEFVENPFRMHRKVFYDDGKTAIVKGRDPVDGLVNPEEYRGRVVKIIVRSKEDQYRFESFIAAFENAGCADLQVVEDHLNADKEVVDDETVREAEDTITIFHRAVDGLDHVQAKGDLKALLDELYHDALEIGNAAR